MSKKLHEDFRPFVFCLLSLFFFLFWLISFRFLADQVIFNIGWMVDKVWLGGVTPHVPMHAHAHTCMHAHARMVNMIISCKWPPPLGESLEFPKMSYVHAHACMHMHVHVCGGHPLITPTPSTHSLTPQGRDPGITQNSIALERIEIFQFCLKI